jgi:hypothetical protein
MPGGGLGLGVPPRYTRARSFAFSGGGENWFTRARNAVGTGEREDRVGRGKTRYPHVFQEARGELRLSRRASGAPGFTFGIHLVRPLSSVVLVLKRPLI